MSQNGVVAGTFGVVDAATGVSDLTFDLSKAFPSLTNLTQEGWIRQTLTSITPVNVALGGITAVRGFIAYVESGVGSLTFTHDANLHGITGQSIFFYGAVTVPQIALSGTGPISVRYMVIG
jgi:hypothetical protein